LAGQHLTTWKILAVTCLLGIATGCEPQTQITTNRATDYVGDPKHILVVSAFGDEFGAEFTPAFDAMLISQAKQCSTEAEVVVPPAWPADASSITIPKSFKPDAILIIGRGSGLADGGTRVFDLQLRDFPSKRLVWRANAVFQVGTGLTSRKQRAETLAIEVTNRMKADGIFRSCAASA
jgi:hypothetical protein